MNVAAARNAYQRVDDERIEITPELPVEEYVDPDTRNRYHRFETPALDISFQYGATVTYTPRITSTTMIGVTSPAQVPLSLLPYLLPSRYCQSDHLMRLASREFGDAPSGYHKVKMICDWIHENVDYLAGSTGPLTSAFDIATSRAGVCRDFAHLGIALCRAVNIPARFVSGYACDLSPPDFHAMFEAWLDGDWYLFDPTRQVSSMCMLRIGTGRDAADVSFSHIFGPTIMTEMEVYAHSLDSGLPAAPADGGTVAV